MIVRFHTNINWEVMEITIPDDEVRGLSAVERMKLINEKIEDALDYYIVEMADD